MSVLVIGAGVLGAAILDALASHIRRGDRKIGVVLRPGSIESANPTKRHNIERFRSQNITIETGDFATSLEELIPTLRKYDVVVQASGMGQQSGTQLAIAQAVLRAEVQHYFPWQYGLDYDAIGEGSAQDLFDEQLQVRKLLRAQQKTKWTIVSTGLFMDFWFLKDFGVVDFKQHTVRALGDWGVRIATTAAEDIGTLVAEAVYAPGGAVSDGVIYTAGDVLSYEDFADRMDAGLDTKFRRERLSIADLQKNLDADAGNMMIKYQLVFGRGTGTAWELKDTFNQQRDIPLTSVADYIEKHKAKLLSSHEEV